MERQAYAGLKTLAFVLTLGLTACANVDAPASQDPVRFAAPSSIGTSQPVLAALPPASRFPITSETGQVQTNDDESADAGDGARLIPVVKRLNCVQFTRLRSDIRVSGNAGTWWDHAKGKYARGTRPQIGAIVVFSSTKRLRSGHVGVVSRVVSDREIRIDHANWTNDGQIHLNASVIDVSPNNDWSMVRVWNTRGNSMGSRVYPIKGFVLPATAEN